ncbi:MAG: CHAT domain-containing protein [Deltaproteobacteria bacterium]|nr:CHAT domain-containing protein [Deltaproteobacteria bacterium]
MTEGRNAFQQGDFEQAVLHWREAARLYEQAAQPGQQSEALTHLAQADQALGQYQEVFSNLSLALALAKQSGDQTQTASVLHSLGNAYLATGSTDNAYRSFNEALDIAKQTQTSELSAAILNDLGNLYTVQKKYPEALAAYRESLTLAQTAGNQALVMRAQINAATASLQNGQYQEAKTLLDQAADQSQRLEPSHDTAYGLITIGTTYRTLHSHLPDSRSALSQRAFSVLSEAARIAETINDQRATSYAWGYLGTLYEDERRYQDALQLTQRATFAAQQVNAPESLYRWQWQTGRVLKAQGQLEEAITAYRGAVSSLQAIRHGMSISYGGAQTSFRESVGPVYFELVDLLLQRAAALPQPEQNQPYLREARETVELLRAAELRDYFRDDCVDAARSRVTKLDVVSQTAVVVYPIILPDRTELLVSLPGGLKRFSVPVSAATLTQEVKSLSYKVEKRTTRQYLPHAQRLYDWLIRPLEPDLVAVSADTLVFVPDGPLRTIPMAVLHDGTQFLISKYAVATTPGLDLTDPQPLRREDTRVLAAGLTESVQGFPALPHVASELQAVQHLYGGHPLLNNSFLTANVEKETKEQPLSIVHIASHGYFAGEVEKSFVLTFDDKLTMDRLTQVVGEFRFRDRPLELLTLSACETAAGDDRAALGLAGVAIQAGARSAVATLWTVNDEAASVLVAEFYQQLHDASVSRAVALQRAQNKLLADRRYRHPAYWSPFLLLNNWL